MIKLKEYRKRVGLTQSELGKLVGVAKSSISQYESGSREPDFETLKKFADVLGVTVGMLLDHQEDTQNDDVWEIRERLRRDPDFRLLFSMAGKATPAHIRTATAMLKALEPEENNAD